MDRHYTYLCVDILCFLFPFLFSFHPSFRFIAKWKAFLPACLITAVFFVAWDILFTHLGVWSFNPAYTLAPRFIHLPLEEVLFFICIPYACVFTYFCLKRYAPLNPPGDIFLNTVKLLALLLFIIALFNYSRFYTFSSLFLLSCLLFYMAQKKTPYLGSFMLAFVCVLPFFFLSNGILTGSFIDEPVVSYSADHNLGIRLFTIPLEDVFYGMLLLLLNVSLYEYFSSK